MITLASVKLNNTYDYVNATAPTVAEKAPAYSNGQTWLDTATGYSYILADDMTGSWSRMEQNQDARINAVKEDTFRTVIRHLQNPFVVERNKSYYEDYNFAFPSLLDRDEKYLLNYYESVFSEFTFNAATKEITAGDDVYGSIADSFEVDDVVLVKRSRRNDGYFTITALTATEITVDEDIKNSADECFIFLADIPSGLLTIIARMVWFDVFRRPSMSGVQSETIGTYSYRMQSIGNLLNYPDDVIAGLGAYEGVAVGGLSYFVD